MRENLLHDISEITKSQKSFKPHKYLLLLSVIKLFESQSFRKKEIYYDDKLLSIFTHFFNIYASETNRNRPYEPFFHLRSHPFWRLRAVPGKEHELAITTTVGGPNMLTELVNCAVISDDMYDALSDETDRKRIEALPGLVWDLSLSGIEVESSKMEEHVVLEALPVAVAA